ncbi:hypothetical protein ABW19_dt0208381 [Dactylella cylindrospora]|nr:hypothetical protein ABW19_dt0208381 [Dactylella cylindrospora]
MYHQNLGSRRFKTLTFELLYETPRQFSGTFPATVSSPYKTQPVRPPFGNHRATSTSSTNSSSSSPGRHGSRKRKQKPSAATKIVAAAAFAEEREQQQQQRGRRRERVSTATTVNGDGVVHEVGIEDLKEAAMEELDEDGKVKERKSSATLSIVLNEYEERNGGKSSRAGTAEGEVEDYTENVESRIPNIPYKSVTHPDVAQVRLDPPVEATTETAVTKPKWRKQPLEKISQKTHSMKTKFDEQKTSFREKIPFFRNGSTMDRIKETFKFSRMMGRN